MAIENKSEQVQVINQSKAIINQLEAYATTMNRIIIDLNSVWGKNADKTYTLQAIGDCVEKASSIAYDYNVFYMNAIKWLDEFDLLEKLSKMIFPDKVKKIRAFVSEEYIGVPNSLKVDMTMLETYSNEVRSFDKNLEAIQAKTSSINSNIDKEILKRFESKYRPKNLNARIATLKNKNTSIANLLYFMSRKYIDTEKELIQLVDMIGNDSNSSEQ